MLDAMLEFVIRLIGQFLLEVVFYGVFYPVGWGALKVVTLGCYPPAAPAKHNPDLVALFPLLALLAVLVFLFS